MRFLPLSDADESRLGVSPGSSRPLLVRLDRRRQGREDAVRRDLPEERRPGELLAQLLLHPRDADLDAAAVELLAQLLQGVGRRDVDLRDRLGVEHEPADRDLGLVDRREGTQAEVLGVGEEQRRVVAVDHQPRHDPRRRVVVDVVHARHAGHDPEHGVVRARDPAQQVEHRQGDGGHDAEEDAEDQHRDRGGEGQHELTGAEATEADQLAYVDQARRGVHDDRREAGHRERRQQRPEREHRQHRADDGDEPAELGALPDGVADRRPAAAAADGDAADQSGAEVRTAEREQLTLRVDRLALAGGERATREDVVGVGHEGDPDRPAR